MSSIPKAPHLQNYKVKEEMHKNFDMRATNGCLLPWTDWKNSYPAGGASKQVTHQALLEDPTPPWIVGLDEENYPNIREVQQDIWIHQHPVLCHDPDIRFLIADWETSAGFGTGAQIAGICGLLAIAVKEKMILVTRHCNRADHDGCKGYARSSWSCYFYLKTFEECRERAFELSHIVEA